VEAELLPLQRLVVDEDQPDPLLARVLDEADERRDRRRVEVVEPLEVHLDARGALAGARQHLGEVGLELLVRVAVVALAAPVERDRAVLGLGGLDGERVRDQAVHQQQLLAPRLIARASPRRPRELAGTGGGARRRFARRTWVEASASSAWLSRGRPTFRDAPEPAAGAPARRRPRARPSTARCAVSRGRRRGW